MAIADVGQDGDGVGKLHVAVLTWRVGTLDQGADQLAAVDVQGFSGLGGRVGGDVLVTEEVSRDRGRVRAGGEVGLRGRDALVMLRVLR
jgi:hypothetical protein